ncbi:DNA recombination protein RmuC [Candidatus Poribacteria bacterium]|nr:DNA recombination protein RmuC [Candidatus Poribacteria bacterium]
MKLILNTILCLLLLGNLVLLILVYRAVKSQPKHIGKDDLDTLQEEVSNSGQQIRSEIRATQDSTTKTLVVNIGELSKTLTTQLEGARTALRESFQGLQQNNENKLDQIRQTVDEQLQTTLEKRLTESFNIVSERLEAVQHGLGTMQNLASEVGSLQRVLTNVSTRGAWGEVQLGAILEQILTSDQYKLNVQPHTGSERVEYAVRLPGNDDNPDKSLWLPIDSKFPTADYQRLVEATEIADKEAEKSATRSLIRRVRDEARDISEKYVSPPQTTDFAIMFLPTEGLNAEVLRQPGLVEELLQTHRIVVAGPTTLTAILLGLRVGFRTLAIQKHSGKIQEMLAAIKTEFREYSRLLGLTQRHLRNASNALEKTEGRSQAVVGKLQEVEELPLEEAAKTLGLPNTELGKELSGDGKHKIQTEYVRRP